MYDNGGRRGEVLFMDEHFHILLLVVEGGGRVCGGGGDCSRGKGRYTGLPSGYTVGLLRSMSTEISSSYFYVDLTAYGGTM